MTTPGIFPPECDMLIEANTLHTETAPYGFAVYIGLRCTDVPAVGGHTHGVTSAVFFDLFWCAMGGKNWEVVLHLQKREYPCLYTAGM